MLKSKIIIKIDAWKWLSVLDFLKGYKPPGCTNSGLQWRRNKSPSAKSRRVFKLRIYLSTDKKLILWLRFSKSLQRNGYYFINGYDLFYNGRNSPESLQAYDPALGATLFKLRLHQICESHVTASMPHGTWGLMQSHFLLTSLKTRLITF